MSLRPTRGSWTSSASSSGSVAPASRGVRKAAGRGSAVRVVTLALVLGLVAGCAGRAPWSGDDAAERAYDRAVRGLADDPRGAEGRLAVFLEEWPRSDRVDDAALALARLRVEREAPEEAAAALREGLRREPRGDRSDAIRLLLARIELRRGHADEAYRVASALRPDRLPPAARSEAWQLRAEVAALQGRAAEELRSLARAEAAAEPGPARKALRDRIAARVAGLAPQSLHDVAEALDGEAPAARVALRGAEIALDAGALEEAEAWVERARRAARGAPSDSPLEARLRIQEARLAALRDGVSGAEALPSFAEVARRQVPSTAGASGALGVVLPLSGPFARYGEAALRGVILAAEIFGPGGVDGADGTDGVRGFHGRRSRGVELRVRDSAGRPARAAAAVSELAADPDVRAVVGPLLGDESEAAAAVAQSEGIPLLALTGREQVAASYPYAFRLGLTPRSEAEALAEYAVDELGVQRFAILHPRDAFGEGLKDLFWDALEGRGARVVGVGRYDPEATDFAEPVRRLIGYLLLDDEQRKALREREELLERAKRVSAEKAAELRAEAEEITGPEGEPLPPVVDFDALFVADTHERAVLLAPQLAFHDVDEVMLLGPSGWNHPDLVRIAGRHVEGAVFPEPFFAESRFAFVQDFRERYRATFGAEPDAMAARAFDAARLVLVQLARELTSREEVRQGLLTVRAHPGISGVTRIGPDGNARKRPFLLGVRGGHVVSLD